MWCVIQVFSGKEMQVKEQLETNNYKAYVPRENRLIRSKGICSFSRIYFFRY